MGPAHRLANRSIGLVALGALLGSAAVFYVVPWAFREEPAEREVLRRLGAEDRIVLRAGGPGPPHELRWEVPLQTPGWGEPYAAEPFFSYSAQATGTGSPTTLVLSFQLMIQGREYNRWTFHLGTGGYRVEEVLGGVGKTRPVDSDLPTTITVIVGLDLRTGGEGSWSYLFEPHAVGQQSSSVDTDHDGLVQARQLVGWLPGYGAVALTGAVAAGAAWITQRWRSSSQAARGDSSDEPAESRARK